MLGVLVRASLEGAVLAALVWVAVRALPALSPAARAALWWCVAAKFIVSMIWTVPIEIPVLPAAPVAPVVVSMAVSSGAHAPRPERLALPAGDTGTDRGPGLSSALLATWYAGVLVTAGMLGRRWWRVSAVIRRAPLAPPHIQSTLEELAERLAFRRTPGAKISSEIDTPLVAGLLRPAVLLPARFQDLSPRQQRLALCHELIHIRRGDLWLGCVPAMAERLFFFHPLMHLASREYVFWRESACDAAVIEALDAAPHEYGRLLLDLGIASPRASLAAAGASSSFSNLKRRIHMLGNLPRASRSKASRFIVSGVVVLALGAAVPVKLVARAPVQSEPQTPVQPAAQAQPPARPQPPASQQTPASPQPPAPPQPPARPAPPAKARELSYVLFFADADDERVHMSGSRGDVERARSFRKGNEPLLWFRNRNGEFVVRDPALLREVENIWKPVGELGTKMGQLGTEQGKLGAKMGEIGAKQGEIGAEQGRFGAKQGAIGAKQAELATKEWNASETRRGELEKAQRDLDRDMRALDEEMKALDARMREFEKPMRDLSSEMEELGKEMETLGRQMERESERAQAELRQLLDRAVESGSAQRVK